jgi:hypothetical protein
MVRISRFPALSFRYLFILNIFFVSFIKLEAGLDASECCNVPKTPASNELIIAHVPDYLLFSGSPNTALTQTEAIISSIDCSLYYQHALALYAGKVNIVLRSHQKNSVTSQLLLYNRSLSAQSADTDILKSI